MTTTRDPRAFIKNQEAAQSAYLREVAPDLAADASPPWRFPPHEYKRNLADDVRDLLDAYFKHNEIVWHEYASSGLSSQVCCLNFLGPLADGRPALGRLVKAALGLDTVPDMLEIERRPDGTPLFVAFEWIGAKNYIGEWPKHGMPTRGANVTSLDAAVRFRHEGRDETLLIEWKYAERYQGGLRDRRSKDGLRGGNLTRKARYEGKVFAPDGPIRNVPGLTLDAFFYEPLYQMLRQQMLAWRTEADTGERVRVLHISPCANEDLHTVTSPWFTEHGHSDVFEAFKSVLAPPADGTPRFVTAYTEELFRPLLAETPNDPWSSYLIRRYDFLGAR